MDSGSHDPEGWRPTSQEPFSGGHTAFSQESFNLLKLLYYYSRCSPQFQWVSCFKQESGFFPIRMGGGSGCSLSAAVPISTSGQMLQPTATMASRTGSGHSLASQHPCSAPGLPEDAGDLDSSPASSSWPWWLWVQPQEIPRGSEAETKQALLETILVPRMALPKPRTSVRERCPTFQVTILQPPGLRELQGALGQIGARGTRRMPCWAHPPQAPQRLALQVNCR